MYANLQRGSWCSGKGHRLGSSRPGFNPWVLHNLLKFVVWCPPSCYGSCGSHQVMPGPGRFQWVHLLNTMLGGRRTPNRFFFNVCQFQLMGDFGRVQKNKRQLNQQNIKFCLWKSNKNTSMRCRLQVLVVVVTWNLSTDSGFLEMLRWFNVT
jgi:hypothetical protein